MTCRAWRFKTNTQFVLNENYGSTWSITVEEVKQLTFYYAIQCDLDCEIIMMMMATMTTLADFGYS